jgi:hypothetical protein
MKIAIFYHEKSSEKELAVFAIQKKEGALRGALLTKNTV